MLGEEEEIQGGHLKNYLISSKRNVNACNEGSRASGWSRFGRYLGGRI